MEKFNFERFNQDVKETINHFYKFQDADSFFMIDALLGICRKQGFTREQIPQLIEMQNIIVMG